MAFNRLSGALRSFARSTLELYFRATQPLLRSDVIVICYAWPDFARKARALSQLFRERGFETTVVVATTPAARASIRVSKRLHVGFWNEFYPEAMPANYVCYNAEPLTLERWGSNDEWIGVLKGAHEVWNYASHHDAILAKLGVPHRYVPIGFASAYVEEYRASLAGIPVTPDIDVLFYGHLTPRRAQLMKDVEFAGCRVHLVTYENPARGAALDRLIARAKIVLSIFAVDDPGSHNVDFARLDYLLSNARFVIQERSPEHLLDADFEKHVQTSSYVDIPAQCAWYIANEDARHAGAVAGHQWFATHRKWAGDIPFEATRALMNGLKK